MKKIIAICGCGYVSDKMINVGRFAYEKGPLLFPCLCEECVEVVEANLDSKNLQCPKCSNTSIIPYDDKSICIKEKHIHYYKRSNLLGRGVKITNGEYKCPKCKEMSLTFISAVIGIYD